MVMTRPRTTDIHNIHHKADRRCITCPFLSCAQRRLPARPVLCRARKKSGCTIRESDHPVDKIETKIYILSSITPPLKSTLYYLGIFNPNARRGITTRTHSSFSVRQKINAASRLHINDKKHTISPASCSSPPRDTSIHALHLQPPTQPLPSIHPSIQPTSSQQPLRTACQTPGYPRPSCPADTRHTHHTGS